MKIAMVHAGCGTEDFDENSGKGAEDFSAKGGSNYAKFEKMMKEQGM